MEVIIGVLLIILEVMATTYVLESFIAKKDRYYSIYSCTCVLLVFILNYINIMQENLLLKMIMLIFIYALTVGLGFKGSIILKFFINTIIIIANYTIDYITLSVVVLLLNITAAELFNNNLILTAISFTAKFILVVICFVINKIIKKRTNIVFTLLEWLQFSFYPLVTLVSLGIFIEMLLVQNQTSVLILTAIIGIVFANVILLIIMDKVNQMKELEKEHEVLKQKTQLEMATVKVLMDSYSTQRKLTHDFDNHLNTLFHLIRNKEFVDASMYIDSIKTSDTVKFVVDTNNAIINALLNFKYNEAGKKGIVIDFLITDLSAIPIKNEDLVVILGNAIDNAVEACDNVYVDEKLITIKIKNKNSNLVISVKNPIPEGKDISLFTSKPDKYNHGYGLKNIEQVLLKYNSRPVIQIKDNSFQITALIDNM